MVQIYLLLLLLLLVLKQAKILEKVVEFGGGL